MISRMEAEQLRDSMQLAQAARKAAYEYEQADTAVIRLFRQRDPEWVTVDEPQDAETPFAEFDLLDEPMTEEEEWLQRAKTAAEYAFLTTGIYIALIILDWIRGMYR